MPAARIVIMTLHSFASHSSTGDTHFNCSSLAWRIKKFAIRGDPKQWLPGKFVHPHDACFDKDGNIFVVEWVHTGRVTLLRHVG